MGRHEIDIRGSSARKWVCPWLSTHATALPVPKMGKQMELKCHRGAHGSERSAGCPYTCNMHTKRRWLMPCAKQKERVK